MSRTKLKSIVVDTLTTLQINENAAEKKKPTFDKWRDYGVDIYNFSIFLLRNGFEVVLILGHEGTGKSYGMKSLEADTNIWYNVDEKNPTWEGGRKEYGTKLNPRKPYHIIPTSYEDIKSHVLNLIAKKAFIEDKPKVAFIVGHVQEFKSGVETRLKLKTLGNLATSMQIEGKQETVLFSKVLEEVDDEGNRFIFETQNNGYNTARSPENMLPPRIPNNYQMVLDAIYNYQ